MSPVTSIKENLSQFWLKEVVEIAQIDLWNTNKSLLYKNIPKDQYSVYSEVHKSLTSLPGKLIQEFDLLTKSV